MGRSALVPPDGENGRELVWWRNIKDDNRPNRSKQKRVSFKVIGVVPSKRYSIVEADSAHCSR